MTQILVLDPAVEFKAEELDALRDAGILIIRALPGQVRLMEAESLPFGGNDIVQVAIRTLARYAEQKDMEPAARFVMGLSKVLEEKWGPLPEIRQTGK